MFCARALMHAVAFHSAVHTSLRCFRFGASLATSSAIWRSAKSQFGCLPFGSLLTKQRRPSAICHRQLVSCPSASHGDHVPHHLSTCHHQVGCASFGAQRRETALPRPTSIRQNLWKSNQGSVIMQWPSIKPNAQVGVFSTPSPTLRCLTGRSSGHQQGPRLRHCLGPCWCPAHLRCSGAAYLGR